MIEQPDTVDFIEGYCQGLEAAGRMMRKLAKATSCYQTADFGGTLDRSMDVFDRKVAEYRDHPVMP